MDMNPEAEQIARTIRCRLHEWQANPNNRLTISQVISGAIKEHKDTLSARAWESIADCGLLVATPKQPYTRPISSPAGGPTRLKYLPDDDADGYLSNAKRHLEDAPADLAA